LRGPVRKRSRSPARANGRLRRTPAKAWPTPIYPCVKAQLGSSELLDAAAARAGAALGTAPTKRSSNFPVTLAGDWYTAVMGQPSPARLLNIGQGLNGVLQLTLPQQERASCCRGSKPFLLDIPQSRGHAPSRGHRSLRVTSAGLTWINVPSRVRLRLQCRNDAPVSNPPGEGCSQ
jgi:hypothetical protein